jgi:hypothetical protein
MPDMNYATLNSLTKYPSIPTYHEIDRGKLSGEAIPFDASDCHVTEKIDGTNGRIVIMPDGDFYIGSREELLHARCDRVINQNLGIVDVLLPHASRMSEEMTPSKNITVAYGEVYGHAIGSGSKNYTRSTSRGVRWFDLCVVPVELLSQTPEFAAKWHSSIRRGRWSENLPAVVTPLCGELGCLRQEFDRNDAQVEPSNASAGRARVVLAAAADRVAVDLAVGNGDVLARRHLLGHSGGVRKEDIDDAEILVDDPVAASVQKFLARPDVEIAVGHDDDASVRAVDLLGDVAIRGIERDRLSAELASVDLVVCGNGRVLGE